MPIQCLQVRAGDKNDKRAPVGHVKFNLHLQHGDHEVKSHRIQFYSFIALVSASLKCVPHTRNSPSYRLGRLVALVVPPLKWPLPQVTSSPPVLPSCQPLHVTRALPPPPKSTGAPFACTPHPSYVVCARQDPWKGPRSPNKCACQHLRRPGIRAGREAVPVEVEAAVELNGDRAARL